MDALYAIHCDFKVHKCDRMSMGHGKIIHQCSKQKLDIKCSKESEMVGVSNFLPYTLWTLYFLRAQVCKLTRNIIFYQDNTSVI